MYSLYEGNFWTLVNNNLKAPSNKEEQIIFLNKKMKYIMTQYSKQNLHRLLFFHIFLFCC